MHADPELTAGWTAAQLGSVLIHHVCHLLRTHGERAQGAGVRPDEAADWVRAADAEINDDLVPAGLDLPGNPVLPRDLRAEEDRKSTRLNSSHPSISYAVFCLKKKKEN